jgi:hypothetical protein
MNLASLAALLRRLSRSAGFGQIAPNAKLSSFGAMIPSGSSNLLVPVPVLVPRVDRHQGTLC